MARMVLAHAIASSESAAGEGVSNEALTTTTTTQVAQHSAHTCKLLLLLLLGQRKKMKGRRELKYLPGIVLGKFCY